VACASVCLQLSVAAAYNTVTTALVAMEPRALQAICLLCCLLCSSERCWLRVRFRRELVRVRQAKHGRRNDQTRRSHSSKRCYHYVGSCHWV
jgi:hypothetical protein